MSEVGSGNDGESEASAPELGAAGVAVAGELGAAVDGGAEDGCLVGPGVAFGVAVGVGPTCTVRGTTFRA